VRRLTTTSYAILGLLAVRPRSAYDLVEQMKRSNIRLIWPRAESKLYEEPKNLVAHGLARVREDRGDTDRSERRSRQVRQRRSRGNGGRRRTIYDITPTGRRALRRWLEQPGAGFLLEFESMLKVVYGDFGSKAQLLANIRRIREGVVRGAGLGCGLVRELADKGPRFPERAHVIAIVDRYLIDMMEMTLRWSQWAERIVAQWPSTTLDTSMAAQARTLLRENAESVEAVASLAPTPAGPSRKAAPR
jgi:DNA-binding PadR family transcriptional regulator